MPEPQRPDVVACYRARVALAPERVDFVRSVHMNRERVTSAKSVKMERENCVSEKRPDRERERVASAPMLFPAPKRGVHE